MRDQQETDVGIAANVTEIENATIMDGAQEPPDDLHQHKHLIITIFTLNFFNFSLSFEGLIFAIIIKYDQSDIFLYS